MPFVLFVRSRQLDYLAWKTLRVFSHSGSQQKACSKSQTKSLFFKSRRKHGFAKSSMGLQWCRHIADWEGRASKEVSFFLLLARARKAQKEAAELCSILGKKRRYPLSYFRLIQFLCLKVLTWLIRCGRIAGRRKTGLSLVGKPKPLFTFQGVYYSTSSHTIQTILFTLPRQRRRYRMDWRWFTYPKLLLPLYGCAGCFYVLHSLSHRWLFPHWKEYALSQWYYR